MAKTRQSDLNRGFEIQHAQHPFVSWDTTLSDVRREYPSYIQVEPAGPDTEWLHIPFPVLVGPMLLPALFTEQRQEGIPNVMPQWKAHVLDGHQPADSFYALKAQMQEDLAVAQVSMDVDEGPFKRFDWQADGLLFVLWYYGKAPRPFTKFSVINQRRYPALLDDTVYERQMDISALLFFNPTAYGHFHFSSIHGDYKRNDRIKASPKALVKRLEEQNSDAPIWRDDKNAILGFGTRAYAERFALEEIAAIAIDNRALSDQQFERAQLKVLLKSGIAYPVLEGAHYGRNVFLFDDYKTQIAACTRCKLTLIGP